MRNVGIERTPQGEGGGGTAAVLEVPPPFAVTDSALADDGGTLVLAASLESMVGALLLSF